MSPKPHPGVVLSPPTGSGSRAQPRDERSESWFDFAHHDPWRAIRIEGSNDDGRGGAGVPGELHWRIIVEGPRSAAQHMVRDEALAGEPHLTLRLFRWDPPAVSLGRRQAAPEWLGGARWRAAGLELVERPTGGGMAFHGTDLSVSVVIPARVKLPLGVLMDVICEATVRGCRSFGAEAVSCGDEPRTGRVTYCLAEPSPYAILIGGRKVAGFAIRRYRESWLIQGSLLVRPLAERLSEAVPAAVVERVRERSVALSAAVGNVVSEADAVQRWAEGWSLWCKNAWSDRVGAVHDAL